MSSATTASLLPTFPRIFFLYLEPIAISYGIYNTYAQSAPTFALSAQSQPPKPTLGVPALNAPSVAMQFLFTTTLYGLVILLSSPPNKRLLQLHIAILALADLTHWYGLFWTIARSSPLGWAAAFDTSEWGPDVWNLATYPVVTLGVKIATLAGWFGEIEG